jgi:glycosyltransferase involved in cell wall biosynthesis
MLPITSLPFRDRAAHPLAGTTVLQLIPALEANPAARTVIDIAEALGAVGARALVVSSGGRLKGELQAKGGVFVPFPARSKNPLAMAINMRRLARLIVSERVDVVHARSRALAWVAYGATRLAKTSFITSFSSVYQGSNPISLRYNSVLARGDVVLADSLFSAGLAAKLHKPEAKIRIVHQGLDCRVFSPGAVTPARVQAVRQQWRVPPHEQIVLLPAAAGVGSGHNILIEAARLLSRSGLAGVKFILASDYQDGGALGRDIDRTIARAGLRGIVYRAGQCDMPAALLAASIVVVPATDARFFGVAAVQAQAMGTPVVAANLGLAPESILAPPIVEDTSRTGFLVPPGDAAALAVAIAKVLSLGATAGAKLSTRAIEHAATRFSVERMCTETLGAYADVRRLGGRRS